MGGDKKKDVVTQSSRGKNEKNEKRNTMAKSNKRVLSFPSPREYIAGTDAEKAIQNIDG